MLAITPPNEAGLGKTAFRQIRRIQEALSSLGRLDGLSLEINTAAGPVLPVLSRGKWWPDAKIEAEFSEACAASIPVDGGDEFLIRAKTECSSLLKPVEIVIRATLHSMEVEKREELLLEELGANWESLDALYEISTDILRSGDIKEALYRLLERLVSLQEDLRAALFIAKEGYLEAMVSTEPDVEPLALDQLGQVSKVMRERHVVVLNQLTEIPDQHTCWKLAERLAAAPINASPDSIGFVVVWREDRNSEFDSPFLRLLEAITYQASMLMESERLNRRVRESELLAKEIEIASSIQETLLLANAPKDVPGMEIATCSIPSTRIDGDFHEFFQHPNGSIDVIVGDVMGKGVSAALLGAATKSQLLRSMANLSLRSEGGAPRVVDVVTRAASRLGERLVSLERFVTLCYARFDSVSKQMSFVDCGHTASILNRKATAECILLQGNDLPLGIFRKYDCEERSIEFHPGDTFLFYSDGVTENRSPEGELFGAERLAECVQNWSSLGPEILVEQIRKEASRFSGSSRFSDDFTCIAIRIRLNPDSEEPIEIRAEDFACDAGELTRFRGWLCVAAMHPRNGFSENDVCRTELAGSELFTNCVLHSGEDSCAHSIHVEIRAYSDHITLRLRHRGPAFDPLSVPPPTFDGSRDNGFGTYIVLRSADEATFERDCDGTNVTTISFLRTSTLCN